MKYVLKERFRDAFVEKTAMSEDVVIVIIFLAPGHVQLLLPGKWKAPLNSGNLGPGPILSAVNIWTLKCVEEGKTPYRGIVGQSMHS